MMVTGNLQRPWLASGVNAAGPYLTGPIQVPGLSDKNED